MTDRTQHGEGPAAASRAVAGGWMAYGVGPAFLVLAAWFWFGSAMPRIPAKQPVTINPAQLDTAPRRAILHDPPTINIDGFERTCMDCHQMFPPREDPPVVLAQHQHVVLDHGINKQCRNCHDAEDRNRLILRGGETISYDEVEQLCAKCHGPTYRDWQRGAHGRTNGYWDAARGPVRRLQCTECHDPHHPRVPAMDPLVPLPGPDTLRMRPIDAPDQTDHGDRGIERDPLRRAIQRFGATDDDAPSTPAPSAVEYFEENDRE